MRRAMDYFAATEPLELTAEGDGLHFRGYAAVFNQPAPDGLVSIEAGAFTKTLKEKRDIRMFLNHDDNIVLASTRAGTLKLREDEYGLLSEASLPDNEWGRPVADAVKRGDITTMSIGFNTVKSTWNEDRTHERKQELSLLEVSPITSWARFPQTTASVYSLFELAGHIEADPDVFDEIRAKFAVGASLTPAEAELISRAAADLAGIQPSTTEPEPLGRLHPLRVALRDLELRATTY